MGATIQAIKQLRHDVLYAFQGVCNGAWLLKNFFLHVVAVRAEFCRTAVCMHRFHGALYAIVFAVFNPILAQLNVDQVTFFEVHNLIGHTCQGHGIAG